MTPEKLEEALAACRTALGGARTPAHRPREMSEAQKGTLCSRLSDKTMAQHLLFMCDKAVEFVKTGKFDKANRWLGFLQGSLWMMGICSIDQMKQINKPCDVARVPLTDSIAASSSPLIDQGGH